MRPFHLAPLVALVWGCTPPPVPPPAAPRDLPSEVVVEQRDHWYPVRGRTVQHIAEWLARDRPEREGVHAWAITRWRVAWHGRPFMHADACRLADVRVDVQIEMTLPRWMEREHAGDHARRMWTDFYANVLRHENGHRAIALRAGSALADALRAVQTPSCTTLMQAASTTARPLLARFRDTDRAYDDRTRTGLTQGAAWPPP